MDVQELVVRAVPEGVSDTVDGLGEMTDQVEDSTDQMDEQASSMADLSKEFAGGVKTAAVGLAVAAGSLLSQVPVLGEVFDGLFAIVEAVAFQMDSVLRPALSGVTDFLFDIADAIFEADGGFGDIIGTLASVGGAAGILLGVLKLLGVALTGPLLGGIALVAGAIAALWLAWRENFGGIRDVAQDTIDNVSERFSDFVETVRPIVMGFLDTLESAWDSHGETIMDVVNFAFRTIGAVIETVIDSILTTIEIALQILSGDWEGAWESMTDFFSRMVDLWAPLLSEAIDAIIDLMLGLGSDLASWASDLASDAFDWGVNLMRALLDGVLSLAETIVEAVGSVINTIVETINDVIDTLPSEVASRLGVERFETISVDPDFGRFGGDGAGDGRRAAQSDRRFGAGGGASTGGQQIDGRQISESTGRYRSDPGRRRGI